MKAFIHVIEIIIITIVMFFVIFQFSLIPGIESDWSNTKLIMQGNDLFFALDKRNVAWYDSNLVQNEISNFIEGPNIIYDVKVKDETGVHPIIRNSINNPITLRFYSAKNTGDYEPFEVILSLGYVFG